MANEHSVVKPNSGVVPHLTIPDGRGDEAITLYAKAFGAEVKRCSREPGGKRIMTAQLALNGGVLMLNDDFPEMRGGAALPPLSGVTLHLHVTDADAAWARALENGFTVRFPLKDQFWGDRYGQVIDPFGHLWSIGATIAG